MEFDVLRKHFKENTERMQLIRATHESKVKEIRETYREEKVTQYLHDEEKRYKVQLQNARVDAIETLNKNVKKIESAQGGMDSHIDTALLTELNAISASGLGLTASELKNIGQKVLSSGSAICARKLIEIAEMSGIKLTMPDPDKARSVLYECAEELLDFYKHYDMFLLGNQFKQPQLGAGKKILEETEHGLSLKILHDHIFLLSQGIFLGHDIV